MAIYFTTLTPKKLLASFKDAIDEEIITDWTYDQDGDFTHTSRLLINKAWLHPEVGEDSLSFFTLPPKNGTISHELYATYHSSFMESMMRHCHTGFSEGTATAQPASKDHMKAFCRSGSMPDLK
jgi:hypothetical protein